MPGLFSNADEPPEPGREFSLRDARVVVIRRVRPDDATGVHTLRVAVASERAFTATLPRECADAEVLRRRFGAPPNGALCLVAVAGSAIVGEVNIRPGRGERTRHVADLSVHVDARFRGSGLGRELVRTAIDLAEPFIEKVTLAVFADHAAARSLYTSLGFVEEGRRSGQVRGANGTLLDDVLMARWRNGETSRRIPES
ncbi:MAG: GNAT family N-acetyltransferase [Phycisphaerales bacterium]